MLFAIETVIFVEMELKYRRKHNYQKRKRLEETFSLIAHFSITLSLKNMCKNKCYVI